MSSAQEPTPVYVATVRVVGGRAGQATSLTGSLDVGLARPADRGTAAGTDPEELFAAGFAACFDSALAAAARRERLTVGTTTTSASVSLYVSPDQQYSIAVALEVHAPDCDQAVLDRALEVAETLCPYAKAVHGNVDMTVHGNAGT